MALIHPALQHIKTADRLRTGFRGAELEHFTPGDGLTFLLQHFCQVLFSELSTPCQCAGGHLSDTHFTETAAGHGQCVQNPMIERMTAAFADAADQLPEILRIRKRQIQKSQRLFQLSRWCPLAAAQHEIVGGAAQ